MLLSLLERNFLFDPISLLAVATAAASGIFLARKEGYNLPGASPAAAPAVGGGLLRDLIAGRRPVAFVGDPCHHHRANVHLARRLPFFPAGQPVWLNAPNACWNSMWTISPVLIRDALGLACFTIIGVVVAMQCR